MLLEPSEHSDVGQPERAAAFKCNPDCQPLGGLWRALAGSDERRHHYSEQNEPYIQRTEIRTSPSAFKWRNTIHGDLRFFQPSLPLKIRSALHESARKNQETGPPLEPLR